LWYRHGKRGKGDYKLRGHLYLVSSILILIIVAASMGAYFTVSNVNSNDKSATMIPKNYTSVAMISTPVGRVYAFTVSSSPGIILPVALPNLVLNRGRVLQETNLSGALFSEYGYFHGVAVYKLSGINITGEGSLSDSYIRQLFLFLNLTDVNISEMYISDTISGHVVIGGLPAVKASLESYFSNSGNESYLKEINPNINDSLLVRFTKGSVVRYMNINSTGNVTNVSLTFTSKESLYEFQFEYLYLESSGKLGPVNITYSGDGAFMTFKMNFAEFVNFAIKNLSLVSG
jgi:hypothetical protein